MATKRKYFAKIIAATSLSIFTLLTSFFGTFAWFTAVRSRNTAADPFKVSDVNEFLQRIDLYEETGSPSENSNNKISYSFSSTALNTYYPKKGWSNNNSLTLGTFDPLNISPTCLILLTLNENISDDVLAHFRLSLSTSTAYSDSLLSGQNRFQLENNPLSSVVAFSILALSETEYNTARSSDTFSFSFASTTPSSTSSFVISLPSTGTSFEESNYQQKFTLLANTETESKVTSSTKYLALFPQYSKEIMEFLFTTNLNNSVLSSPDVIQNGIAFSCDWSLTI